VGFITQEDMEVLDAPGFVAIYLPHSYNFSGNLILVRKEQVKLISLSSTDAMKFVVSGGVTSVNQPTK
jgi:uncharacterized membrane protein